MQAVVNTDQARFNMIEQQIRPWDVLNARVLETLSQVPRERFVPNQHKALAFSDLEIPLSDPIKASKMMLAPRVEARLLQDMDLQSSDHVLEIGTGVGLYGGAIGPTGATCHHG